MTVAVFDPLRAIRALVDHNVQFVVIGGFAARIWGSPTVTNDLDICYSTLRANIDVLATVLQLLNARPRDFDRSLPFILDARTIALGNSFTLETDAGNLDCLATPAGTEGLLDLERAAREFDLGEGLRVKFASLEDVMRMKLASGRRKDLIELEVLKALRAEREANGEG